MVVGRVIQGAGGGIFPLAFGIVRDEFPRDKVAGSIGMLSSILGVGGGIGIVLGGLIVEHLDYHWLYWIPLIVIVLAAVADLAVRPRVAGPRARQGQLAGGGADDGRVLLRADRDLRDDRLGLGLGQDARRCSPAGLVLTGCWMLVEVRSAEPLIDMAMMRIRGVWTTNLVAFLLGAGMYASFLIFPQFAQLPKSTGFGFGASVVTAGLYLLPAALGMSVLGIVRRAGRPPLRLQGPR